MTETKSVKTPPEGSNRIMAMLTYDKAPEAIEFLCRAFGFQESFRMDMPDGKVGHAELCYEDGVIMLASAFPDMGLMGAQAFDGRYSQLYVYVDDVDAHFAKAKEEGADIIAPPEDMFYGDRRYQVADLEGHQWFFATNVKYVPPEELMVPQE